MEALSQATGLPEPTLRLLTSLLAGYPLAYIYHRLFLPSQSENADAVVGDKVSFSRNLYNLVTGFSVAYFFCGVDVKYTLFSIIVTWSLLKVFSSNRRLGLTASFIFNCGYLLTAYYFYASNEYDINWTTPQSVLCLRLIGFSFDYFDGRRSSKTAQRKSETAVSVSESSSVGSIKTDGNDSAADVREHAKVAKLSAGKPAADAPTTTAKKATSINAVPLSWSGDISMKELPSLLETLGYAYFYGSFTVGPQFSFSLYKKFITNDLFKSELKSMNKLKSSALVATGQSFLLSLFYIAFSQGLQILFPSSSLLSSTFLTYPFWKRALIALMAGKAALSKYLVAWKLTEGSCQLAGIGFNGVESNGSYRWNGLRNIDIWNYESATSLAQIIGSFNVNTNYWAKLYLFKRLRFLGSKNASSVGTLVFLAIWHGFHPGYAFAFSLEFVDIEALRRLQIVVYPYFASAYKPGGNVIVKYIHLISSFLFTFVGMNYAGLGFDLLTLKPIIDVMNSVYWFGHWGLLATFMLTSIIPRKRTKEVKKE